MLLYYSFLGYQDILNFVHNEYDVDKAEVQSALTYYRKAGSKELIALHESISKVFIMFGGCMDAESEDDEEEDDEEDNEVGNRAYVTDTLSSICHVFFMTIDMWSEIVLLGCIIIFH